MSAPYDNALRLQLRRERAETDAAYERARIQECMCACGRAWEEGARFCDACGVPVGYTGKTERLDNQGPRITDYGRPSSPFWK